MRGGAFARSPLFPPVCIAVGRPCWIVTPLMALATYERLVPSWIYLGVPIAIVVTI